MGQGVFDILGGRPEPVRGKGQVEGQIKVTGKLRKGLSDEF
jgi:hypothetical protein